MPADAEWYREVRIDVVSNGRERHMRLTHLPTNVAVEGTAMRGQSELRLRDRLHAELRELVKARY